MIGRRIAIYGLGRSGLAVARAALALGGHPVVYDQATPEQMTKQDVLDAARELGVELKLGWYGEFDASNYDWLVVNPSVDSRSPTLRQAVADGLEVMSEVEFAYRVLEARFGTPIPQPPSPSGAQTSPQGEGGFSASSISAQTSPQREGEFPTLVAITGTNGKSTTTVMAVLALRECGIDAVLCGNIFGSGLPEMALTEAALLASPEQVLVAEISSFQLEWVSHFRPAVAGLTNIAPDHLDRYDSFEDYRATKMRIFAAQTPADFAVVGAGDPTIPTSLLRVGGPGDDAEVRSDCIRIVDRTIPTDSMQVMGVHNYENAAMAGLIAWAALSWRSSHRAPRVTGGRSASGPNLPESILRALAAFRGIEHRMEFVGSKNGVRIINNSMCTNPEAVVKSAQAIVGPVHLLIGGRDKLPPGPPIPQPPSPSSAQTSPQGEGGFSAPSSSAQTSPRGEGGFWAPVASYLRSGTHRAYLYGEAKNLLNDQLGGGIPTYNTLHEAFRAATEKARPGETILLAPGCASNDQFQDFRDRGNVFKTIAKEWLES